MGYRESSDFRRVLWTGRNSQLVMMTIPVGKSLLFPPPFPSSSAFPLFSLSPQFPPFFSSAHIAHGGMCVCSGGDIGEEIHTVDQHLSILSGTSLAQVNGKEETISAGDVVIVPAGAKHQFINKGPTPLILTTVYAPGEHKADTVHKTKEEGDELEESGKDEPPQWARDLHKKDDGSN